MYKVSLAIPIYNVSLFVERALLSVLNQTYDNTLIPQHLSKKII